MKRAFTLAETLISLVIIGVIAAVTVPAVVNHYTKQAAVSKVKKFTSSFSNAINLAISANGAVDIWDLAPASGSYDSTSAKKFANYIKPYLSIIKDCGTASSNDCMDDTVYKKLNGANHNSYGTWTVYYKIVLNDGSLIWFRTHSNGCTDATDSKINNTCAVVVFDINGKKAPNQIGKDTFILYIKAHGIEHPQIGDCKLNSNGYSCLNYILLNENMDYPKN